MTVVGFDTVVGVLDRGVQRVRCQLTDCFRQRCSAVGDHLRQLAVVTDRQGEEPARGDSVAPRRHVYVNDLATISVALNILRRCDQKERIS